MGVHTAEATATADGYVGVGVHRARGSARPGAAGRCWSRILPTTCWRWRARGSRSRTSASTGRRTCPGCIACSSSCLTGCPSGSRPSASSRTADEPARAAQVALRARPGGRRGGRAPSPARGARRHADRAGRFREDRLALQAAAEVVEDLPHGAFFVTPAAITDPALVLPQVAQTLGVNETRTGACGIPRRERNSSS